MTQPKEKPQFSLQLGKRIGAELVNNLMEYTDRIKVAGSVRRNRDTVGDVELLCIPKRGDPPLDMFQSPVGPARDLLTERIEYLIGEGYLAKRPSKVGVFTFGGMNKLMIHVQSGVPVDIFSTDTINWGMALVVRTGPKDFNIRMMNRFKAIGMNGHAYGGVSIKRTDGRPGSETVNCPDEKTVFDLLQWVYQEPEVRK